MKLAVYQVPGVSLGKHNVKDPRLDAADKLVEAKKKIYVQADIVGEDEMKEADAILVPAELKGDLVLLDMEFLELRLGREQSPEEKALFEKLYAALESEKAISELSLSDEEKALMGSYQFVTNRAIVPLASGEDVEQAIVKAYDQAGYISFLTLGGKENRAWPIRKGTVAVDAAGTVHTDMQKGFIRAEIISYADLIECGGEVQAKRANKVRLETKTYVMQDYDVVNFRFNR